MNVEPHFGKGGKSSAILKVHGPIFQRLVFRFHLKNHHSKDESFCWNGQAVWMYEASLYIAVAYILLCYKLNYGYHNQAHFH